jgi:hypothetical protein
MAPAPGAVDDPAAELQSWAYRLFEQAYERSVRREKCSRADFWAGYRAALVDLHSWSSFLERPTA